MVSSRSLWERIGPGLHVPARLLSALLIGCIAAPTAAQNPAQQQAAALPVPDSLTINKLLWSTMVAVDQANKTGNYSVLRDLGTPGFQANNNAANLANLFGRMREAGIDISNALLVAPTFDGQPGMIQPTALRVRGAYLMRPYAIRFDVIFQWRNGWMIDGLSVVPVPMNPPAPAPAPARTPTRR